jgi:two-component system CheB/CheR fusion protein
VPEPVASPLRVLVVDDCQDMGGTLAVLLRLWGHEPRVACDGPGALEAARTCRPDVVLVDIGLPGMSGWELASRLRGLDGMREALLVAVSGYASEEDRRHSLEAGCALHLIKPFDPNELRAMLTAWAEYRCAYVRSNGPRPEPARDSATSPGPSTFRPAGATGLPAGGDDVPDGPLAQ